MAETLTNRPDSLNETQFLLTGVTLHINFRGMPNGFMVSADSDARFTHYNIGGNERSWRVASRPEKTLAYNSLYHIYVAAPIAEGREARIEMYVSEKIKQPGQAYLTDDECYLFKVGELTASEVAGSEDLIPRGLRSAYFGNDSIRGEKIIGRMTSASGNSFIDWDCDSFQFGDPNSKFYFQWNVEAGVAVLKGIFILDSHGQKVDIGSFLGGNITDSFLESLSQNIRLDRYFDLEKVEMQVAAGGLTLGGPFVLRKKVSESGFEITASVDHDGNALLKSLTIGSDFVPGVVGGRIDKDANAELKSLTLREFLNVPELRYNRVSVIAGEQWSAPGGGIIEGVNESNNRFKLKLEPGELPALQVFDLCKGIFNIGSGFATAYFRIENIAKSGDDYIVLYSLRPGTTLHPRAFMHFVAFGNTFNTSRQASAVQTREYIRFMAGVDTWEISASMIRAHIGNMSGMSINGVDLSGYSGLLHNFYFDGTLAQLAPAIADSEQNTKDYVDEKTAAENLALQNFINNTYTQEMLAMQSQIDGQLESFFLNQDPTNNNAPANGWTTVAQKESHLNDTYTNLSTGKSWRWTKYGNAYGWLAIADTATEKALMIAGQAKDTADSKRRTFIATPYPPYDAGDLWVTPEGELMKCIYARASGSYVASDWDKATKYTDDSAVNNMVVGVRNLVLNSNVCETSDAYGFAGRDFSIPLQKGKDYTLLVNGRITPEAKAAGFTLAIYLDWYQKVATIDTISDTTISVTFRVADYVPVDTIMSIRALFFPDSGNKVGNGTLNWYAVFEGNKAPLTWVAAPEDVQSEIDDAKNTGAAYNSMGEYSSATYYTGSRYQRDVVWIDNSAMATGREYFVAKINAGTFVNVPTSYRNNWESIGAQFSSIATDFLLARKIQGDEIDTDTLIVKSLQTSKDVNADQRIVIDHNTNSMVMSKSGKDVLIISGKKVAKLEDQLNEIGGMVIPISKSGELKNVERVGYMPNVETDINNLTVFTYHVPSGFLCKIPPIKLTIDSLLSGYFGVGIHEQANSESTISMYVNDVLVYSNISRLSISKSNSVDNNLKEFVIPEMIITTPGDYNVKITLHTNVNGYFENNSSYARSYVKGFLSNINVNDNIVIYAISELTELFANGMMSKYSTTKYMAVINTPTDPVWVARDGNYGLKVGSDGVKIMRNGINWTNL